MGEVTKIATMPGGIVIECTPVDYDDIFKSYFGVFNRSLTAEQIDINDGSRQASKSSEYSGSENKASVSGFRYTYPLDFMVTGINGIDRFLYDLMPTGNEVTLELVPQMTVRNDIVVAKGHKVRKTKLEAELTVRTTQNYHGAAEKTIDKTLVETPPVAVAPMLNLFWGAGIKASFKIDDITYSGQNECKLVLTTEATFSDKSMSQPTLTYDVVREDMNNRTTFGVGSGSVDLGIFMEAGVETILETIRKKLDDSDFSFGKLSASVEGGIRFRAKSDFVSDDWLNSEVSTNLYKAWSQPDNLSVGPYCAGSVTASILYGSWGPSFDKDFEPFYKRSFLPTLTDCTIDNSGHKITNIVAFNNNSCLSNAILGVAARDITDSDDPIAPNYFNCGTLPAGIGSVNATFKYPPMGHKIQYDPYFQLGSKLILAEPSCQYYASPDPEAVIRDSYVICYDDAEGIDYGSPCWDLDIIFRKTDSRTINNISVRPDGTIDKSLGRMYHSNLWGAHATESDYEYRTTFDITDSEVTATCALPLDNVNLYFSENNGKVTLTVPLVVTVDHADGSSDTFTVCPKASYNVAHTISGLSFEKKYSDISYNKEYTLQYDGKVEGLVVYALFLKGTPQNRLYRSVSGNNFISGTVALYGNLPSCNLLGGVIFDSDKHYFKLRDGEFTWTYDLNFGTIQGHKGLECDEFCDEWVWKDQADEIVGGGHTGFFHLPFRLDNINNYYRINLPVDMIKISHEMNSGGGDYKDDWGTPVIVHKNFN